MIRLQFQALEFIWKNSDHSTTPSPPWGRTTKLVVALSLLGVMLARFQYLIPPVVIAFIVAYLLYPVSSFLHKRLHFHWRLSVALVYLVVILGLVALLTWGGFNLISQLQNLVDFIDVAIRNFPQFLNDLEKQPLTIGPLILAVPKLDLLQL